MRHILFIALGALLVIGCGVSKPLYEWENYDNKVYSYTKSKDAASREELIKTYEKLIKNSGGSRGIVPPGICADYGYLLIEAGNAEKGKELLIKETVLYPESKPFIDRILKRLEK